MAHSQKSIRDHARNRTHPNVDNKVISQPGAINAIKLQLWASWLLYAVVIDLSDEVADELTLPFDSISIEMVFRGIYHFTQALNQGFATDIIAYLTAPENRDLGIVKSPRPKRAKPPLNLSPFPS